MFFILLTSISFQMIRSNGEAKREEKLRIKQLEKEKKEAEKEEKRQKRMQEEAVKEEKRRGKEECELWKQKRKQQEEADKDQRRREKEEAELKKQISLQKQASIMDRFLKRTRVNPSNIEQSSAEAVTFDSSCKKSESQPKAVTCSMDCAFSSNEDVTLDDILKYALLKKFLLSKLYFFYQICLTRN